MLTSLRIVLALVHVLLAAQKSKAERVLLLPSGGHYVGDISADFRQDGLGSEYRADGSECASGQWHDGKLHGLGTEYGAHGSVSASGEWADGKLHGFGLRWDQDGELEECGRFEKGELEEECAVPLSKIPAGAVHNENGERRTARPQTEALG